MAKRAATKRPKSDAPFSPPVWPASTPRLWKLDDIKPYPNNAKTHPPEQVNLLAELMRKFGVDQPIVVDEDGVILKGHGRLQAAYVAKFEEFPVVQHIGLSDSDKIALRLSDNQVPLLGGWNDELIKVELGKLKLEDYPMQLLGFSAPMLAGWLDSNPGHVDPEIIPEPPKKPVVRRGDLWVLGRHRILCGDSTNADDVKRVLGKAKPLLMVTDPPYGVEYDPNWRNEAGRALDGGFQRLKSGKAGKPIGARAVGKVLNDDRSDWREAWALFPGDVAYVWHAGRHASSVEQSLRATGFNIRAQIIWVKSRFVIGRGDYHWQHEPCWYAVREGKVGHWAGDRSQTTVWPITHQASETGHGTQKPIDCMKRPIENNSKAGDVVYEPFSGSGTTIIAAEMTGRLAVAIELDPSYVQLAIERWQTFAKGVATLDGVPFDKVAEARKKGEPRRLNKKTAPPAKPEPLGAGGQP